MPLRYLSSVIGLGAGTGAMLVSVNAAADWQGFP
jgi:hypothetical protein